MKNYIVQFKPTNKSIEVAEGTCLIDAARRAGVFIDAPCGGKGHCGKCRVTIKEGKYKTECSSVLTPEELNEGIRLACHTWIESDMIVEIQEINVVNDIMVENISQDSTKSNIVKRTMDILENAGIKVGHPFQIATVKLSPPTLDDNIPDWERLKKELNTIVEGSIHCPLGIFRKLPGMIRKAEYKVTVVLHEIPGGYEILNIQASEDTSIYGLSVDIGTTTVAACLVNLRTGKIEATANSGNLQMQYGADVINRIIYSSKDDGLEKLRQAIVNGSINQLIKRMTAKLKLQKSNIVCSVIAGNTTMTHMFMGVVPEHIRLEPYIPAFGKSPTMTGEDCGLDINLRAPVYLLPNVASYVGGDIVSGVLAAGFWNNDHNTLFLDLGTNGEIVLGNQDWMVTCACSAGPAFEGGEISCGMRAATGAIDRITINRDSLEPSYSVIGDSRPKGICGSGLIDLMAEMFLSGVIDRRGKLVESEKTDRVRYNSNMGCFEYVVVFGEKTDDGRDIAINDVDIDNFLRAKGAVYSGIRTLLNNVGLDVNDLDQVIIAGGIGQNLNIQNSIILGLLPDIKIDKYDFIGNSSLTGAYASLMSKKAREKAEQIANMMTYIELSVDPAYMEEFVSACFLPHTDIELFPSLKGLIDL